ncbi:MAG TPA: HD domain-containing protein [Candidatus Acidoferrales bacterium]|nr:HD domain-containing protein [Candidatus Acidoferrales bacterium]
MAAWLALRIASRSGPGSIDRALVESAALLHDVDKALPRSGTDGSRRHGETGARWLAARGYGELTDAVTLHPVTILPDDVLAGRLLDDGSIEAQVVAYADKRGRQRVVSMADRFDAWTRRHPTGWSGPTVALARERAETLERQVCEAAGVRPEDVRRLRWTGRALATARTVPGRAA